MNLRNLFFFIFFSITSALDLLRLKSHWDGNGVGFVLPGSLTLLSNKLVEQTSLLTSHNFLQAGKKWSITAEFFLKCRVLDFVDKTKNDFGIGLFLTNDHPKSDISNYNHENFRNMFGMTDKFKGVALIFFKNNLYVHQKEYSSLSRVDLFSASHVCKAYLEKKSQISLRLNFNSGILSIYISEHGENNEVLCQTLPIKSGELENFYISISAADKQSKCEAKCTNLKLTADLGNFVIVPNAQKRFEDSFYSFFDAQMSTTHFKKVLDFQKESENILSNQILRFADLNQKEVVSEIENELASVENLIESGINVTEEEARQIELLESVINIERTRFKNDTENVADELLTWLTEMEQEFEKVDEKSALLEQELSKIEIGSKFIDLIAKTQKMKNELEEVLQKSDLMANSEVNFINPEHFEDLSKKMEQFVQNLTANEKNTDGNKNKRGKYSLLIVIFSIWAIVICIIFSKIKKVSHQKRII